MAPDPRTQWTVAITMVTFFLIPPMHAPRRLSKLARGADRLPATLLLTRLRLMLVYCSPSTDE